MPRRFIVPHSAADGAFFALWRRPSLAIPRRHFQVERPFSTRRPPRAARRPGVFACRSLIQSRRPDGISDSVAVGYSAQKSFFFASNRDSICKTTKKTNMSEIPTFTGFYLVLLGFTSFYLRLPACTGCYCIFTEIDQILPGCCVFLSIFTGFYLDSPGLTGFYCVFTEIFQL